MWLLLKLPLTQELVQTAQQITQTVITISVLMAPLTTQHVTTTFVQMEQQTIHIVITMCVPTVRQITQIVTFVQQVRL
jgi:hypothetical protein